ncbi:transcriptional regulator GcvA [Desulfospira joergensenii]|uniref:transcriptional regulator GcvA n=1 Tax=Desulfospira joergensenii TaxID=53329 RepID=UPI0003B488C4|nr:transcriptional regulator GcvA [Desulfospira joergensenii]
MPKPKVNQLPSLNGLKAFETAARLLSFTRAARELNVTQGAVSRQVKLLEKELDVILFHRRHRALALTEQGRLLASSLARAFDLMAEGVTRLKNQQQDLNLKIHPTFAIRWLIPRLHLFQSLYPDIRVRLTTSGENVDFSRENFDAGITHLGEEIPGVTREPILKEQLIPVCAPRLVKEGHHPLAGPEDLRHHTLLHNSPDYKEWAAWADQTGISGLSLERGQVFEVDDAALQAATAGLGVALGDLFLVRDELASGRLIAPLGLPPIRTGNYYFSWPNFNKESRGVRMFGDWLISTLNLSVSDFESIE